MDLVRNPVCKALYPHKKRNQNKQKLKKNGWAGPCDPCFSETYSKFVKGLLLVDLWMENCQILMIFSYFFMKMQSDSCSRLGFKNQQKQIWRAF